jgi:hypothetical protein
MPVITGRCRESRAYLWYCLALFWPGVRVPVFEQPIERNPDIAEFTDEELQVVLDEGRRHLDRQRQDLERVQTRSATAATIGLAEIALLSSGGATVIRAGAFWLIPWLMGVICVFLGVAGAVSLLTTRPAVAAPHVNEIATYAGRHPLYIAAYAHVRDVGIGDVTLSARVTVLRDVALLLVLGAVLYAATWPFVQLKA